MAAKGDPEKTLRRRILKIYVLNRCMKVVLIDENHILFTSDQPLGAQASNRPPFWVCSEDVEV